MCKASIFAEKTRDAAEGDQTELRSSSHMFPEFRRPQDEACGTVTCAKMGQIITLTGIPDHIKETHGIDSDSDSIEVAFIEDVGDVPDDGFCTAEKRRIDLYNLALASDALPPGERITATMGRMMSQSERKQMINMLNNVSPARTAADRAFAGA